MWNEENNEKNWAIKYVLRSYGREVWISCTCNHISLSWWLVEGDGGTRLEEWIGRGTSGGGGGGGAHLQRRNPPFDPDLYKRDPFEVT